MRPIDADALKAWFFRPYSNEESYCNMDVAKAIDNAPTVDAVPVVHGEWKPLKGMQPPELHGKHYCSNCDHIIHLALNGGVYNYCPNCGAKMDGEQ